MRPRKRLVPLFAMVAVLMNVDAAFGCSTKAKAYQTAMKSDLRNLVSAQESFHSDSGHFSRSLVSLGFKRSTGTNDPGITLTSSGWYATNSHSQLDGATCTIYVGERPKLSLPETIGEGEPYCENPIQEAQENFDGPMALGLWAMLGVLTLTGLIFLARGLRKWVTVGSLFLITLIYPAVVIQMCGPLFMEGAAFLSVAGLSLMLYALRRDISTVPNTAT